MGSIVNNNLAAQRTVATSTPVGYSVATVAALLTSMVSSMASGQSILASDVQALVTICNYIRAHTHAATDLEGLIIFGNIAVFGSTGSATATVTTSAFLTTAGATASAVTIPSTVTASSAITASDINTIIAWINALRTHKHTIVDTVMTATVKNHG